MHFFKDLEVWKLSIDVVVKTYAITAILPPEEKFGLVTQMNRAAVSSSANIAEGCGRNTKNDFNHFLDISMGSSFELETLLIVSQRINYITEEKCISIIDNIHSVQKMLYALRKSDSTQH